MPETRVSPRERLVLTAIIELYIATGEPWPLRRLRDFRGPRRVELGDDPQCDGFAGRGGPAGAAAYLGGTRSTAAAFRYYVEQITRSDAPMGRIGVGGADCDAGAGGISAERRAARTD